MIQQIDEHTRGDAVAPMGGVHRHLPHEQGVRAVGTAVPRDETGDGAVVFHNTLAASDYGLIDEVLTPRKASLED